MVVQTYMPSNPEWNLLKTEIIEPNQFEFIPTAEKGTRLSGIKDIDCSLYDMVHMILYGLYHKVYVILAIFKTDRLKCPI